ncbi:MAG: hypothetical protein IJ489_00020, partial [Clostridia bacterium]|nr:hypothetical protein [Clostridia bacterium]
MKNLKRLLCICLVMAMICLLPSMTHIVSAATKESSETDNTVTMTRENQISGQPLEAVSANRDLTAEYESGIWKQSASDVSAQGIALASEATTQTPPDMMYALRKVNPVFSVKNNNNETIDLNTGSLNLSYPLASMAGVNGMDLSLSLNYSSASANTRDRGYADYCVQPIGYVRITYVKYSTFTYFTDVRYKEVVEAEICHEDILSERLSYYNGGPYINNNPSGYVQGTSEEYYYEILDISNISYGFWYMISVEKSTHVAEKGLGYGWNFNIPYIKPITAFDENGNADHSYKIIVLDNGENIALEDDVFWNSLYEGYAYTATSSLWNGKNVTHILSYKDGTKYYFDADDICIGKEDRFGNQIQYNYTASGKLSSISDNFGRSISLTWLVTGVSVTSSDGSTVKIDINANRITSITYNERETTEFTYTEQNAEVGYHDVYNVESTLIPYHLLIDVQHPNGSQSCFRYEENFATRPDGTRDDVFQVSERYDLIDGEEKNNIEYEYYGCYLTDYSDLDEEYYEKILDTGETPENIWEEQGVLVDYLAILTHYSTIVSDGISNTTYYFNPNGRCNSIEVRENGVLLSVIESLYEGDNLIATRETLADSAGDTMSYFTTYTYDTLKNVVSVKKFQNGESIYYEETATYNNPYSLITSSAVNGVVTNYTYSSDSKTLSSVEIREDEILREKAEYTYLSNGNIKTEKVYILPGSTTVTTTYHYG